VSIIDPQSLVYDTEFSSETIYKSNKCMILSVLKSSHVSLKILCDITKKKNYCLSLSEIQ